MIHDLGYYQVDSRMGFLPSQDPLECLPNNFLEWERVASQISVLLATGNLRSTLEMLMPVDIYNLDERQAKRAFLLLSIFGNAYVWGGEKPANRIPAAVAVPLCELAARLERRPIVAYGSIALDNWRRLDKSRPLGLDNMAILQLFEGGLDERWFYMTTIAMEAVGATAILPVVEAQNLASLGVVDGVVERLKKIALVLGDMYEILSRIPQKCDPYIFYHRVRLFIAGWPDPGVIYEGVCNVPQKFFGGSAAQSSLIQSLDVGLGIQHSGSRQKYLHEMRSYMPPGHRKFIEDLESESCLREFVIKRKQSYPYLCELYNTCVQALENLRNKHMQIAISYITRHANHKARGTGGTDFINFLQNVKQETATHLIT